MNEIDWDLCVNDTNPSGPLKVMTRDELWNIIDDLRKKVKELEKRKPFKVPIMVAFKNMFKFVWVDTIKFSEIEDGYVYVIPKAEYWDEIYAFNKYVI